MGGNRAAFKAFGAGNEGEPGDISRHSIDPPLGRDRQRSRWPFAAPYSVRISVRSTAPVSSH
eukprot:COSAG01_NODE_48793_length_378_cov_0.498208_1_plen_61_part_10